MNGSFFFRWIFAIVLIAALVGIGSAVYNAGVTHGLADGGQLVAPAPAPPPAPGGTVPQYPYYYGYGPFYRPWGFGTGFGFLGCLFPILFFFLIFALIRGLFFHGWGWGGRFGRMHGNWPSDVPPAVEEWHRKMHEKEKTEGDQEQ